MCGIAGILRGRRGTPDDNPAAAERMTAALAHRGPDGAGHWHDPSAGISLGHRRLAVVELSERGDQPMRSADGRWVLVFNGEIYNFKELRTLLDQLGVHAWNGNSDSEVLVEAIAAWGIETTLQRCDGMFAFAVWDRRREELHLARDRFGEKPLYVSWRPGLLAFASELRGLSLFTGSCTTLDPKGLRWLMRMGYIPAPCTPFRGVFKLPHGTYLTVSSRDATPADAQTFGSRCQRYWSSATYAEESRVKGLIDDSARAVAMVENALEQSLARRLVTDVPLGAFLSGGIDSSLVVALMTKLSSGRVQTYTIGFDESSVDESEHAARVAEALGTDHHVHRFRVDDALALVPQLPAIYDEPLADPSQLPTVLLCRAARKHVKVALSGEGGDELFLGYQRQFNALLMWRRLALIPSHLRGLGGLILDQLGAHSPHHARRYWRRAALLRSPDAPRLHAAMSEHWSIPGELSTHLDSLYSARLDAMANMRLFDQMMYLPGALMPKSDRASMSVGLELRMPFLETGVLELAWRMPNAFLYQRGEGKWILRRLLARHLPASIAQRKKQGFAVPLADWLRSDLRGWAESLIAEAQDLDIDCLDTSALTGLWRSHVSGTEDASDALWTALTLLSWLRSWRASGSVACA